MQEVRLKTHLIITDIHSEYTMNWCGRLIDANPRLKDGKPVFTIIGSRGRMELDTIDMNQLEYNAKLLTKPKGRSAISKDVAWVYLQEADGGERLMGVLTHKRVKSFAPMHDKIGVK